MKWLAVTMLVLLGVACSRTEPRTAPVAARDAADLEVTITREDRAGRYALSFEVSFEGDPSGRTAIALPSEWGGQEELWKDIGPVTATGATLEPTAEPHRHIAVHPPGARVGLRYSIAQQDEIAEIEDGRGYRPLVQASYFHLIGQGFLVTPDWDDEVERRVRLRWEGLAEDVGLANSFGVRSRDQAFSTTLSRLRHAVYVGGDFRVHTREVRGKPVHVAMRGSWAFSDGDYLDLVEKVVAAERAFFGDDDFDRFLVTLIPTGGRCCSYGGTGLTDSFATFIATDLPIEARMKHLLAHELFHTWNGRRIGRQDPEELVYWFSEGFTDYYARLLLLRAGLITLADYVASYNTVLRTYQLSSARNAPNTAVLESFWSDRAVERLAYQRGDILAHEWNLRIRAERPGASIDDVMRDLFRDAMHHGAVVSAATVDGITRRYLTGGVAGDIARHVDAGETLVPSPGALGPCVRLEEISMGPFDLGFDEAATDASGVLTGVRPDGPAYAAGARDGMKVKRLRYRNDPQTPVLLVVLEGELEYLPQGARVPVPQYRIERDGDDCLAFFAEKVILAP